MRRHELRWLWREIDRDWDGVVAFDYKAQEFVRYLDRTGRTTESVKK